jgi:nitrite reductase/ring-hydroxylating ferredoxin subunit
VNENPSQGSESPAPAGRWIAVAASDAVSEGSALEVLVEEQILAVFRYSGRLYALDGMCAHQGGPIAQGTVQHGCVTCPWHGWQYELETGIQTINRQPLQKTYPVREADGQIEVRL